MIIGFIWDKFSDEVLSQIVRDTLATKKYATGYYWNGSRLDSKLGVLNLPRVNRIDMVSVWRTYQLGDVPVPLPTSVDSIPCDLRTDTTNVQMFKSQKKRLSNPQGARNTFNPFDIPMPDSNSRSVDPRVKFIWT